MNITIKDIEIEEINFDVWIFLWRKIWWLIINLILYLHSQLIEIIYFRWRWLKSWDIENDSRNQETQMIHMINKTQEENVDE